MNEESTKLARELSAQSHKESDGRLDGTISHIIYAKIGEVRRLRAALWDAASDGIIAANLIRDARHRGEGIPAFATTYSAAAVDAAEAVRDLAGARPECYKDVLETTLYAAAAVAYAPSDVVKSLAAVASTLLKASDAITDAGTALADDNAASELNAGYFGLVTTEKYCYELKQDSTHACEAANRLRDEAYSLLDLLGKKESDGGAPPSKDLRRDTCS